jgi:hypothetical protein
MAADSAVTLGVGMAKRRFFLIYTIAALPEKFALKINKNFDNDPVLEVLLLDEYGNIYVNVFNVPLQGNTDIPIMKRDKRSAGILKDSWRGFIEWANKHK